MCSIPDICEGQNFVFYVYSRILLSELLIWQNRYNIVKLKKN